jgi:alanine racemase
MIRVSAGTLTTVLGGRLHGTPHATVSRVLTDSRAFAGPEDCFVAIRGPRFDGAEFADTVLRHGASVAIVAGAPPEGITIGADQAWIEVDDGLDALQRLATWHRSQLTMPVIAITGSNGKTITKDLLGRLLSTRYRTFASPQSWNSQVGVSLSVLRIDPDDEVAVIECGISAPGEMSRLQRMVQPTHGLLTNVGDAHLHNFVDAAELATEKIELFAGIQAPANVLGSEPSASDALLVRSPSVSFMQIQPEDFATARSAVAQELAADRGLLCDIAASIRMARSFGIEPQAMREELGVWRPASMRLQMLTTPRGVLILDDAYIADGVSLENALLRLRDERSSGAARTIAVLGGVSDRSLSGGAGIAALVRRLEPLVPDILIGVGESGTFFVNAWSAVASVPDVRACRDAKEAALLVDEIARAGDCVLLKGSASLALEVVADQLGARMTSARVLVNMAQVVSNFESVRRATGVGTMAVVKAFGYGLDAARVARELERAGIEHFCVAYPAEGVLLRERGISTPILVQNVLPGEAGLLLRHRMQAEVGSVEQLRLLAAHAAGERDYVEVHLKVDTGMGRMGVLPAHAFELFREAAATASVRVVGLMTHFSSSESTDQSATLKQIALFEHAVAQASAAGLSPRWIHACNSSAIANYPQAHYSMVRLGIGLFGYSESGRSLGQAPALTMEARIVEVKDIPEGWPVGYGARWHAPAGGARIAVVSVGYNDGYPRALSNRAWMSVRGVRCPVVGSVCMDVSMVDVSGVSGVAAGDIVCVFGVRATDPTVEELAELADTIPYELLTRLSGRVRRVHVSQV